MNAPSPPRRPSRLTWPVFSRLPGRLLAALARVWVVALVAWPERHWTERPFVHRNYYIELHKRDSSLSALLGR